MERAEDSPNDEPNPSDSLQCSSQHDHNKHVQNPKSPVPVPSFTHKKRGRASGGKGKEDSKKVRRLIYHEEVYMLGDTVLIRESPSTDMIARIEEVIGQNGDSEHPTWPMIRVTW
eukprot:TRINITY_DN2133_c0_g1_i4.p2 TRINITY_DN2133_c0_g1~~TRINITY_DN2133_c0_g1_i4.p2  ORF type:complete len:115 (-),score=12.76 TRINITY_DN2133_c0_g1_i4:250-594(-)